MRKLLLGFARFVRRLVATIAMATLLVFVAIEASIRGGFRSVLFPSGFDETSARHRAIADEYHLDDNVFVRWCHWVVDFVQGDWGRSTRNAVPVWDLIEPRLSISIELMLVAAVGMIVLGIPLGLLSAAWSERRAGRAIDTFLGVCQTVPVFVTPIFLTWIFSLELRWLPPVGWVRISDDFSDHLRHLALPATALIMSEVGGVGRLVRADVLGVLQQDYIAAARTKGLSSRYLLVRHAMRPGSLPTLNVLGLNMGSLLSGALIVELIFGIGGLGQLIIRSTLSRDLSLMLVLTTYVVIMYVTLNAIVDAVMRYLDPRLSE